MQAGPEQGWQEVTLRHGGSIPSPQAAQPELVLEHLRPQSLAPAPPQRGRVPALISGCSVHLTLPSPGSALAPPPVAFKQASASPAWTASPRPCDSHFLLASTRWSSTGKLGREGGEKRDRKGKKAKVCLCLHSDPCRALKSSGQRLPSLF